MKSHLIQPDIDYCGVCMESKLLCVLLEENVEVDAWVEKFSDGKWRDYAQELMGLKPHELDALEKGDP